MVTFVIVYKRCWCGWGNIVDTTQDFPKYQRLYINEYTIGGYTFYRPLTDFYKVARWLAQEAISKVATPYLSTPYHVYNPNLVWIGFVLEVAPLVNGYPIALKNANGGSPFFINLRKLRFDLYQLPHDKREKFLATIIYREVLRCEGKLLTKEGLTLLQHFQNQDSSVDDFCMVAVSLVFIPFQPEKKGEKAYRYKSTCKNLPEKRNFIKNSIKKGIMNKASFVGIHVIISLVLGLVVLFIWSSTLLTLFSSYY